MFESHNQESGETIEKESWTKSLQESVAGSLEGFEVEAEQVGQNRGSESLQQFLAGFFAGLNPVRYPQVNF